jgi:hypothetical protein
VTDPRCGTPAGHNAHRRLHERACQPCRDAQAAWQRHYRTRLYVARGSLLIDPTGTRRRLHALMRIGWSADLIGAEFDITGDAVKQWMINRRVRRETAAKVAALYDRWWDAPGPSVKTAARAKANGWPPPMAWNDDEIDDPRARAAAGHALRRRDGVAFDEVAVELAVCGYPARLRPAERAEVVRRLTRAGLSAAQIAQRLDTTPRSVVRWRGKAAS